MAGRKIFPLSDQHEGSVLVATDLVDEMLGCYISWREDAAEAADAYGRWRAARRAEKRWRFATYLAALDLRGILRRELCPGRSGRRACRPGQPVRTRVRASWSQPKVIANRDNREQLFALIAIGCAVILKP